LINLKYFYFTKNKLQAVHPDLFLELPKSKQYQQISIPAFKHQLTVIESIHVPNTVRRASMRLSQRASMRLSQRASIRLSQRASMRLSQRASMRLSQRAHPFVKKIELQYRQVTFLSNALRHPKERSFISGFLRFARLSFW